MSDECMTEVWVDGANGIYLFQVVVSVLYGQLGEDIRYAAALRGTEGAEEAAEMFHHIEGGADPLEEGWEYGDYESLEQAQDDHTHFWADLGNYDIVAATYFGKGTDALFCSDPEQASDYMTHEFSRKLIEFAQGGK